MIGAFSLARSADHGRLEPVAEYRYVAEYTYRDDPIRHDLRVWGRRDDLVVRDVRFGHAYGYPDPAQLWTFDDWIDDFPGRIGSLDGRGQSFEIEWPRMLPYPAGEDFVGPRRTPTPAVYP